MELNSYTWSLYKRTDFPIEIGNFEKLTPAELLAKYNPRSFWNIRMGNFADTVETLLCWLEDADKPVSSDEAKNLFGQIPMFGVNDIDASVQIIGRGNYEDAHDLIEPLSVALWKFAPEYFIPYFFANRYSDLIRITDAFSIELPITPHKSDHKGRYAHYWEICYIFYNFRKKRGFSPNELCTFLYSFAPRFVEQKNHEYTALPSPQHIWMIGGLITGYDKEAGLNIWQANKETKRGDILVHYETTPVSAITHIWRAASDGVNDPFFHYAAQTFISDGIEIPHISLAELKNDTYFSKHPLIRKNFQGVNGWQLSSTDYNQLLKLLTEKSFDTTFLPKPYAPRMKSDVRIKLEKDVESYLLRPLLASMGLVEERDYKRQLELQAGRGSRVFPDFALRCREKDGVWVADIIIEAKLCMKDNSDVDAAFRQGRSYANLLEAKVLVTCDSNNIYIYKRKNGQFNRLQYLRYTWSEMEDADKYNIVKKLIGTI